MTTYEFYTGTYYGDMLTAENFEKWESRACDLLNFITNNTITDAVLGEYSDNIQKAVCSIAELLFSVDKVKNSGNGAGVKSMSSGGESITYSEVKSEYVQAASDPQITTRLAYERCRMYLTGTGLLYGGIDARVL